MALTQDLPISNSMYKLLNLIIDARLPSIVANISVMQIQI